MNRTELRRAVHARLLDDVEQVVTMHPDVLMRRCADLVQTLDPHLVPLQVRDIAREVVDLVTGFGPLEPLLRDPNVREVMVNGPGVCFVERGGRLEKVPIDIDVFAVQCIVERAVGPLGLRWDRSQPMVEARLGDGSRLHAVAAPIAPHGPVVTIRRFADEVITVGDFESSGTLRERLLDAVERRDNVLIAGATNAGKTTLLSALVGCIAASERVITIEETMELRLRHAHVVRLEARPPNGEGAGEVTVRQLVRAALRMRPDRLIVGEIRGDEASDVLQALNTGHRGSFCTIHANSAADALIRLETLAMLAAPGADLSMIRQQVRRAIDVVVFVERSQCGTRSIRECESVA